MEKTAIKKQLNTGTRNALDSRVSCLLVCNYLVALQLKFHASIAIMQKRRNVFVSNNILI